MSLPALRFIGENIYASRTGIKKILGEVRTINYRRGIPVRLEVAVEDSDKVTDQQVEDLKSMTSMVSGVEVNSEQNQVIIFFKIAVTGVIITN